MTEHYHVVPWYNSEEWRYVYDKLFIQSSLDGKQDALNILSIWKARCPSLPSGIESTLLLLEVQIQDNNFSANAANDQLLRLAYSSAVMRFVNNMLDKETAKGASFYNAAKNLGVPDWVVDLRHDTAHSSKLPSLEILREATCIAFHWLQENYWEKHKQFIKDYKTSESPFDSILNDTKDLFGYNINLSQLTKDSMSELTNLTKDLVKSLATAMKIHSKLLLKGNNISKYVTKALLGNESLFLSVEVAEFIDSKTFEKHKLNSKYVQNFEILLTFLHANDLLFDFIMELIYITQDNDNSKICELAALWVSEILLALKRSINFKSKLIATNYETIILRPRKEVKALYYHWFPNKKRNTLLLDLGKTVPEKLQDLSFIKPIISTYNSYVTYYMKELLNLLEPPLPHTVCSQICDLARLISSSGKFPFVPSKIYTIEDLEILQGECVSYKEDEDMDSDCMDVCDQPLDQQCDNFKRKLDYLSNSFWQLSSHEQNWSTCPIGILPWQFEKNKDVTMEA